MPLVGVLGGAFSKKQFRSILEAGCLRPFLMSVLRSPQVLNVAFQIASNIAECNDNQTMFRRDKLDALNK